MVEKLTDHQTIYLAPLCDEQNPCERMWCEDDKGPCDECGKHWIKFVRAALSPRDETEKGDG